MLTPLSDAQPVDRMEAIAIRELPALLQPYACTGLQQGQADDTSEARSLQELAERSRDLPVTCIAGTTDRVLRFVSHVRSGLTGRDRLAEIWPGLAAVLYARGPIEPDRVRLENEIASPDVLCLEVYFRPEGAIAVEDPRHGELRLLPDQGVYFEFVPVDQMGKLRPERHSAAEVELGVPYALALSSPAGIWACLVGGVVRFEQRDPPLLRLVETRTLWEPVVPPEPAPLQTTALAPAFPVHPPHARPAGHAPARPGRHLRNARSVARSRKDSRTKHIAACGLAWSRKRDAASGERQTVEPQLRQPREIRKIPKKCLHRLGFFCPIGERVDWNSNLALTRYHVNALGASMVLLTTLPQRHCLEGT